MVINSVGLLQKQDWESLLWILLPRFLLHYSASSRSSFSPLFSVLHLLTLCYFVSSTFQPLSCGVVAGHLVDVTKPVHDERIVNFFPIKNSYKIKWEGNTPDILTVKVSSVYSQRLLHVWPENLSFRICFLVWIRFKDRWPEAKARRLPWQMLESQAETWRLPLNFLRSPSCSSCCGQPRPCPTPAFPCGARCSR